MLTILLLTASNVFMTFAWYGHLKYTHVPLWQAIAASWGIAFFEYCLMVPANRWGYGDFSVVQLKTIQEIVTLSVFAVFAIFYIGESIRWNHLAGFACLVGAAYFMFRPA
jgi:uncharacterized protein